MRARDSINGKDGKISNHYKYLKENIYINFKNMTKRKKRKRKMKAFLHPNLVFTKWKYEKKKKGKKQKPKNNLKLFFIRHYYPIYTLSTNAQMIGTNYIKKQNISLSVYKDYEILLYVCVRVRTYKWKMFLFFFIIFFLFYFIFRYHSNNENYQLEIKFIYKVLDK